MLLNLLNFFEDSSSTTSDSGNSGGQGQWVSLVILAGIMVAFVLLMIIPNRRQKKKAEEMMSKLTVGSTVTTIGGIVGEVVQLDEQNIWLLTGSDENKCVMQFVRQAIHSVMPAPGSPEGQALVEQKEKEENEVDEIK